VAKERKLSVKVPERLLPGVYANQMVIRHTREEFLIDFVNRFPPEGVVAARVIVSPGHLKRMIRAIEENVRRFEATHGPIIGATAASPLPTAKEDEEQPTAGRGPSTPADPGPQASPATSSAPSEPVRPKERGLKAKVPDGVLAGVYANQMVVSHSPEEFLIDFINVFPPEGVVTARVFVSPEQLKRMARALQDNFDRYEAAHGTIVEATVPRADSFLN
jgi:hypothetical protein